MDAERDAVRASGEPGEPRDERTTPPRWRVPSLLMLAAVILYFGLCYRVSLAGLGHARRPAVLREWPRGDEAFWPGFWHMFANVRDLHTRVECEGLTPSGWVPIDLVALYPTLRVEGPSYARPVFYGDPARVARMAEDVCARAPVRPRAVRLYVARWPKVLGRRDQPRVDARVDWLGERACAGAAPGIAVPGDAPPGGAG